MDADDRVRAALAQEEAHGAKRKADKAGREILQPLADRHSVQATRGVLGPRGVQLIAVH